MRIAVRLPLYADRKELLEETGQSAICIKHVSHRHGLPDAYSADLLVLCSRIHLARDLAWDG